MMIRAARPEDAMAACVTMRRSITELCTADHGGDPAVLERWLANKTPASFLAWLARADNTVLVAVAEDAILAVGAVTDAGEINLNYVSPAARFRGVSRAMLAALEARAAERGSRRCILTSTATARRLYETAGYTANGPPEQKFGVPGYPMVKALAAGNIGPAGASQLADG
jgi:GNAT superfamily N-acetyltransferase